MVEPLICVEVFDALVRSSAREYASLRQALRDSPTPQIKHQMAQLWAREVFWAWEQRGERDQALVGQRIGGRPVSVLTVRSPNVAGFAPVRLSSIDELDLPPGVERAVVAQALDEYSEALRNAGKPNRTCTSQAEILHTNVLAAAIFDPGWPIRLEQFQRERARRAADDDDYIDLMDRAWQGGAPGLGRRA